MKKNGQYVGVDEKYIPEEDKYVEDTASDEIKESINSGVKSAKSYLSDDENKQNIKEKGKKVFKIGKGIAIGYGVFYIIVVAIFLVVFITTFVLIFRGFNRTSKFENGILDIANKAKEEIIEQYEKQKENNNQDVNKTKENDGYNIDKDTNNGTIITKDEYNKIKNGMSYAEVVEIVGGECTKTLEQELAGITQTVYTCNGEGNSKAMFTFSNDSLKIKLMN